MQIPVPRAPLPGRHLRRPRQRPLRPPHRADALRRGRVRRRRARRAGRDRAPSGRSSSSLSLRRAAVAALAAEHPERVAASSSSHPALPLAPATPLLEGEARRSTRRSTPIEGWAKFNRHYWLRDYRGLPRVLLRAVLHRAALDQADRGRVGWGLETDAETLIATSERRTGSTTAERRASSAAQVRCPVLVIHGDEDAIAAPRARRGRWPSDRRRRAGHARGLRPRAARARPGQGQPAAARLRRARAGAARALGARPRAPPQARAVRLLADRPRPRPARRRDRRRAAQAAPRPRDRLARPAPGHRGARGARRADPPGERAPGQRVAATSSRESAEHDLHCFQAIRRMDEILLANFMVFHDVVARRALRPLDRRRGVGARLLPAREPGAEARRVRLADRLRRLAADARRRRARGVPDRRLQRRDDRAHRALSRASATARSSSATPTTSCPTRFGAGLPLIRDWTEEHFDFAGYVTGFDPAELADRDALRAELGYGRDEQVCIVTVGGSGVGGHLLRRVIAAFPEAKRRVPELRMIVVAGPRIDPASLPAARRARGPRATSTTSTATSPPATSPSSRAG